MDWKELKHEINMSMVDFRRARGLKCNVLVLGKKEYEVLQSEETKKDCFRVGDMADYETGIKFGNDSDGDIAQIWSMRICRINVDSMVKAGHVV